jgi:lysozyme
MVLDATYLDRIKKLEGYYAKPYWDHKQWSVGYGSRASGPNDTVDEAEAERRLGSEMQCAASLVDQFAPGIDPGTRAALVSLTYNAGPKWMQSGLGQAIKSGDLDKARASFLQYNKASGQVLPGLVNRRAQEVGWFGSGPTQDPRNAAPSGGGMGVDPDGSAGIAGSIHTSQPTDTGVAYPKPPVTATPSSPAPMPSSGGAFGGSIMAGLGKNIGAFGEAMGGEQSKDIGAELAKANQSALSEEEQRAAQALQMVTARNPRKRQGAFG